MDKDVSKQVCGVVFNYGQSIRSLLNIVGLKLHGSTFKKSRFEICKFSYESGMSEDLYKNWIRRHAFIDIFELTREVLFTAVIDLSSKELDFDSQLNVAGKNIKNKPIFRLEVKDILEILGLQNEFSNFILLFDRYKKIRNSLTHRFGMVNQHDSAPLYFRYYTIKHGIQVNKKIYYFKSISEINKIIRNHHIEGDMSIVLKFDHHTSKYETGSRIIISDEHIYGVSGYLHANIKEIFTRLFSSMVDDFTSTINKADPFKMKYEFKLKSTNNVGR